MPPNPIQTRIVRIISRLNVGGPARHVILLADRLREKGYETILVTGTPSATEGDMIDLARQHGIEPVIVPELGREISPLRDLKTIYRLVNIIHAIRPEIVHTHTAKAGALGRVAAALCRVPTLLHTYHGHVFHGYFGPVKSAGFRTLERWLAHFTKALITLDARLVDELVAYRIAPRERFHLIPLGLDLNPFFSQSTDDRPLRQELGIAEQTILIGIVARLVPIKRLDLFLNAAHVVTRRTTHPVAFVIVGDGDRRAALEHQCKNLNLANVHFLGFRRDLSGIYASLDIACLSSDNEGLPVSLIEAATVGCPLVATRVGAVPSLLIDNLAHRCVPAGSSHQMADALIDMINHLPLAKSAAIAYKKIIYQQFHIDRLVDNLDHLYRNLLM